MEIKLTPRLRACADFCRKDTVICDVGTDHALLACYLALNGAKEVIASDINDGPLTAAKKTIEQCAENVRVIKSDGLDNIGWADDVIIAGMGGELIAEIITKCRFLSEKTRFILQPMTKPEQLRRLLYQNGFSIIEERVVYEKKRAYIVMLVRYTGERVNPSELFIYAGKIKDARYLKQLSQKIRKISEGRSDRELDNLASDILRYAEEINEN